MRYQMRLTKPLRVAVRMGTRGFGTSGQIFRLYKVRFQNTPTPGVFRSHFPAFPPPSRLAPFHLIHPFAVDPLKSSAID